MVAGQPDRVQSPARNKFPNLVALDGPRLFQSGAGGKRGANFLHHVRLLDLGVLDARKELRQFPQRQSNHFAARHFHQAARCAHHQLQIPAAGFVEHPLNRAIQQSRMG